MQIQDLSKQIEKQMAENPEKPHMELGFIDFADVRDLINGVGNLVQYEYVPAR